MVQGFEIDQWGIDPLSVQLFDQLDGSSSAPVTVTEAYEGDPQSLSAGYYGTVDYWILILIANALVHPSELEAGLRVILPVMRITLKNKPVKTTTL